MQLSVAAANVAANAVTALLNGGYIRVYTGPRPASTEVAISTQTLLAAPRFNATAFGAAANGVAVANAVTEDSNTPASGTAAWFRLYKSDGVTVIADGSVGVGDLDITTNDGFDMELASTTINAGRRFAPSAMQYTQTRS